MPGPEIVSRHFMRPISHGVYYGITLENILHLDWQYLIMWLIGGLLIFLAIKKDMEPSLLLPLVRDNFG